MKNLICLLIVCFITSIESIRAPMAIDGLEFISVLNSMFTQNMLAETKQIIKCFEKEQSNILRPIMYALTETAANAGSVQLKNFPHYYHAYIDRVFSPQTIKCFYSSRDVGLLMLSYSTDRDKMASSFTQYAEKNYLSLHSTFTELKSCLDKQDYATYGIKLNELFIRIFGRGVKVESEWQKGVSNLQNFDKSKYYGITVSNGVIGSVSSYQPLKVATTVLGGAQDVYGRGRVSNILKTFPALQIGGSCGGTNLVRQFYNYEQKMDIKKAQFSGAYSTASCSVKYRYMALKNSPFSFYTSIELIPQESADISIQITHEAPDYLNSIIKKYENIEAGNQKFNIMHTKATSKTGSLDVVIASTIISNTSDLTLSHQEWNSNDHFLQAKTSAIKGNSYQFAIITTLISSAHHQDPANQAIRIIQKVVSEGESKLISSHQRLWNKLWEKDIVIQGNDEDQKNIRLMLYHCYAFINDFKSYGISPMGLSGLGYNGHVFWDMDIWIYPGILGLNPTLAKTLIQYRFERLEAARNNAFINGYKGAMFPWESALLGIEQTPVWALTGSLEHHISGCVSFAAWNYFAVTQDLGWLRTKGFQIISSVAQFWQSRVQKGEDGFYHINNVVCPDQWAQNVNDNAFTNSVAKETLKIFNIASKRLGLPENSKYSQIAEKLVILKMQGNITRQHDQYAGQPIKQADVNLLAFPLKSITDIQQIRRDLQYYRTKIPDEGTPAMTFSIFTILYARLQDPDNAYKYFLQSHRPYFNPPFNVFSQGKGGTNPYFLTGAGGVIQSMVFGFGGYDITQNGLKKIQTVIPSVWKSVTIKGFLKQS